MAVVMRTLATRASAGSLVGAFNYTHPAQTPINTQIKSLELNQPEGTLMELRLVLPSETIQIPVIGSTVTLWNGVTAAQHIANTLNADYAKGTLKDPASGQKLVLWPKPSTYPVAVASGNTVTIRWVKLQPFAYILVGILVAALAYFAWHYLSSAGWTLSGSQTPTSTGGGTPKLLGLPWYIPVGVGVAVVIPLGYWYGSKLDRNRANYMQAAQDIHRLEGRR